MKRTWTNLEKERESPTKNINNSQNHITNMLKTILPNTKLTRINQIWKTLKHIVTSISIIGSRQHVQIRVIIWLCSQIQKRILKCINCVLILFRALIEHFLHQCVVYSTVIVCGFQGQVWVCGCGISHCNPNHDGCKSFGVCFWALWVGFERRYAKLVVFGVLTSFLDQPCVSIYKEWWFLVKELREWNG